MAKIVGYEHALSGNAATRFLWGNTAMTPKSAADHLTMLAALVAIGYVGYVAVKEFRHGRRR